MSDTIAAIATPPGKGGIAIVRISGEMAPKIMRELFSPLPDEIKYRHMYYGKVMHEGVLIDKPLCVLFGKGSSYTGEDLCEFHCHGGYVVANEILAAAISLGARPAQNGEFTKRAFLNGRLDLSEAEAVCDIINAESSAAAHSAALALSGVLARQIKDYQNTLLDLLALIDALIDYPEEIDEDTTREELRQRIQGLAQELAALTDTYKSGRILRDGLHVCIAGLPNAGKSSLLNVLSGRDSAIVTPIAGTTRDILHEIIEINSLAVHLYDTAGLRESGDQIEQIGIERAYSLAEKADAILYLIDASQGVLSEDEKEIAKLCKVNRNIYIVFNKTDLSKDSPPREGFEDFRVLNISTVTKEGINELRQLIFNLAGVKDIGAHMFITNERHYNALCSAQKSLQSAYMAAEELPIDCVAVDLRQAWQFIGELTGETVTEDIIDRIFENFCVGK